jgi:hypothetical protein
VAGVVGRLADHGGGALEAAEGVGERLRVQRSLAVAEMLRLVPVRIVLLCGVLRQATWPSRIDRIASWPPSSGDSEITVAGLSKRAKRP